MLDWIIENRYWIFSGVGVAVVGWGIALITQHWGSHSKNQLQKSGSNSNSTNEQKQRQQSGDVSTNVQVGRDVNISIEQLLSSGNLPLTQSIAMGWLSDPIATGSLSRRSKNLHVRARTVHTGKNCAVTASLQASVGYLTEKIRTELGFGNEARAYGTAFPFMLRWVLVDVKAANDWKQLTVSEKQKVYAVTKSRGTLVFSFSSTDGLEKAGIRDGMEFQLFPIQDEVYDSPGRDSAMLDGG